MEELIKLLLPTDAYWHIFPNKEKKPLIMQLVDKGSNTLLRLQQEYNSEIVDIYLTDVYAEKFVKIGEEQRKEGEGFYNVQQKALRLLGNIIFAEYLKRIEVILEDVKTVNIRKGLNEIAEELSPENIEIPKVASDEEIKKQSPQNIKATKDENVVKLDNLQRDIKESININSLEGYFANTPDYMLSEYAVRFLRLISTFVMNRDQLERKLETGEKLKETKLPISMSPSLERDIKHVIEACCPHENPFMSATIVRETVIERGAVPFKHFVNIEAFKPLNGKTIPVREGFISTNDIGKATVKYEEDKQVLTAVIEVDESKLNPDFKDLLVYPCLGYQANMLGVEPDSVVLALTGTPNVDPEIKPIKLSEIKSCQNN